MKDSPEDRLETLSARALDRDLSLAEEDWLELEDLLRDEGRWEQYRRTLDTEVLLRGMGPGPDVEDEVMEALGLGVSGRRGATAISFPVLRRGLAAAALLALGLWLVNWVGPSKVETLAEVQVEGSAELVRSGVAVSLDEVVELREGDRLSVGDEGEMALSLQDDTRLGIRSGTVLEWGGESEEAGDSSKVMSLAAGTLWAEVAPQAEGQPMVLLTEHGRAVVRGTRFELKAGEDASTLAVEEGRVDLVGLDGQSVSVVAGETGVASSEGVVLLPQRIPAASLVRYDFGLGEGSLVPDLDASIPGMSLRREDGGVQLDWVEGGLRLDGSAFLVSEARADELVAAIQEAGEVRFEVWLTPSEEVQGGPARLVALSRGSGRSSVFLAQGQYQVEPAPGFVARTITDGTGGTATKGLGVPDSLARLTHLVFTHASGGEQIFYVNGKPVSRADLPGGFSNWPSAFPLSIGGDLEGEARGGQARNWMGTLHFVAIYDKALSAIEVQQNFEAGHRP